MRLLEEKTILKRKPKKKHEGKSVVRVSGVEREQGGSAGECRPISERRMLGVRGGMSYEGRQTSVLALKSWEARTMYYSWALRTC